eukprot:444704_1
MTCNSYSSYESCVSCCHGTCPSEWTYLTCQNTCGPYCAQIPRKAKQQYELMDNVGKYDNYSHFKNMITSHVDLLVVIGAVLTVLLLAQCVYCICYQKERQHEMPTKSKANVGKKYFII